MKGAVLLTGATGFVGMEILARYLERTDRTVIAPVRARDEAEATRRMRDTAACLFGDEDAFADRLVALPADIEQPGLGLDHAARESVSARVAESCTPPRRCPSRYRSTDPGRSTSRALAACSSSRSVPPARGPRAVLLHLDRVRGRDPQGRVR